MNQPFILPGIAKESRIRVGKSLSGEIVIQVNGQGIGLTREKAIETAIAILGMTGVKVALNQQHKVIHPGG